MNIEEIKQKYKELAELKSKLFDSFGMPEDDDLRMESFDFEFYGDVWKKTKNFIRVAETEEELNDGVYESLELSSWHNQAIYQSQENTMVICVLNNEGVIYVLDNSKEIK